MVDTKGNKNVTGNINATGNVAGVNADFTGTLDADGKTTLTTLKMTPQAAPTPEQGLLYFDSTTNQLKVSETGSAFTGVGATDYVRTIFQGVALTNSNDQWNHPFSSDTLTKVTFTYSQQAYRTLGTSAASLTTPARAKAYDKFELFQKLWARWRYEIFTSIDECNNSSYDTSLWETLAAPAGSVTETTRIDMLGQGTNTSSYTRVRSRRPFTVGQKIILRAQAGTGAGNDVRCAVGCWDGTTYLSLFNPNDNYWIMERTSATNVKVSTPGTGFVANYDISSLNTVGTINIHFEVGTSSGPSFPQHLYIYNYSEVQSAPTTSITLTGSANGGTNYNNLTNNQVFNVPSANQGQSMIMKLAITPASATEGLLVYELLYTGI